MSDMLKVACAQTASVPGDLAANVEDHLATISQARSAGVDCLLFPEMSLTGHGAGPDALDLAIRRDHPIVARLAAASGPMRTTFGLIEEGPAAQFHNATFTLSETGLIHVHRKVALATYGRLDDGKHFAPGRSVATFPLGGRWSAAVLICNDVWNPTLVALAALQGATILLAPASSALEAVGAEFDNPGGWDIVCRHSAVVYGLPVLFANRVGTEGDLTFWGGSRVLDAYGATVAEAGAVAGLAVATLDYAQARRARRLLPTVRDLNLDLLVRETARLQRDLR